MRARWQELYSLQAEMELGSLELDRSMIDLITDTENEVRGLQNGDVEDVAGVKGDLELVIEAIETILPGCTYGCKEYVDKKLVEIKTMLAGINPEG